MMTVVIKSDQVIVCVKYLTGSS